MEYQTLRAQSTINSNPSIPHEERSGSAEVKISVLIIGMRYADADALLNALNNLRNYVDVDEERLRH
eukprot:scaffold1483_cov84-Skeletonema_dohrnii-CCMP3373.AAC.2